MTEQYSPHQSHLNTNDNDDDDKNKNDDLGDKNDDDNHLDHNANPGL